MSRAKVKAEPPLTDSEATFFSDWLMSGRMPQFKHPVSGYLLSEQSSYDFIFYTMEDERPGAARLLRKVLRQMKQLTVIGIFILATFGMSQTFETFFSNADVAILEQLVEAAQLNDSAVLETLAQIEVLEQSASFEGRLTEAININAGAGLEGNFYDQATPKYSISISVNIMDLVTGSDTRKILDIQLDRAKAEARVRAVEAFVGYKVATNAAEAAARSVEASEAMFSVTAAQYTVGDAILANQITAQGAVAQAAVGLLSANGQVIVALEQLASATGLTNAEVALLVGNLEGAQARR